MPIFIRVISVRSSGRAAIRVLLVLERVAQALRSMLRIWFAAATELADSLDQSLVPATTAQLRLSKRS